MADIDKWRRRGEQGRRSGVMQRAASNGGVASDVAHVINLPVRTLEQLHERQFMNSIATISGSLPSTC